MIEVACGVMFNYKNQLLIGLRKDKCVWEFPGGKRESNETIEECLSREWKEELNVNIIIEKEICSYKVNKFFCRFFIGKIIDSENISKNVHKEITFIHLIDILKYTLFPEDTVVVDTLLKMDK